MIARSVLVTGATAPLGMALVRALLDEGHTVLATGVERDSRFTHSPRLHYVHANLQRSRELRQLLFGAVCDLAVDAVIHTAGHRRTDLRGERVRRLHVEATREMLHLCGRHPTVKKIVIRSYSEIYRVGPDLPALLDEEQALDLSPSAPQWIRDHAEADLTACAFMAMSPLRVVVLRLAECLADGTGSQLADYLTSRVCFMPLGFDPMLCLLSIEDAVIALRAALAYEGKGVFNIPGRDVLPLSALVRLAGRIGVPAPEPLLAPLYGLRALVRGTDFRWEMSRWRFHYGGLLDGSRARAELGYTPRHAIAF